MHSKLSSFFVLFRNLWNPVSEESMVVEQRSINFVTLVRHSNIIVGIIAKTCTPYYLNNVSFLVQPRYGKLSGIWDMSSLKKECRDVNL